MSRQPTAVGTLVTTALLFFSSLDDDSVCRELGDGALAEWPGRSVNMKAARTACQGLEPPLGLGSFSGRAWQRRPLPGVGWGGTPGIPTGLCGLLNFRN